MAAKSLSGLFTTITDLTSYPPVCSWPPRSQLSPLGPGNPGLHQVQVFPESPLEIFGEEVSVKRLRWDKPQKATTAGSALMDRSHLVQTGLLGTNPATMSCPGGSCMPAPHGRLSGRVVNREGDDTRSRSHRQVQLRAGSQGQALPAAGAALGLDPGGQGHGTVLPGPILPISTWDGANTLIPSQDHAAIQPPRCEGFPQAAVPPGDPTRLGKLRSPLGRLIPWGSDSALP